MDEPLMCCQTVLNACAMLDPASSVWVNKGLNILPISLIHILSPKELIDIKVVTQAFLFLLHRFYLLQIFLRCIWFNRDIFTANYIIVPSGFDDGLSFANSYSLLLSLLIFHTFSKSFLLRAAFSDSFTVLFFLFFTFKEEHVQQQSINNNLVK